METELSHPGPICTFPDYTREEPWRIFRIMAELVDSFELMSKQGPLVTIFGSARTRPGTPDYEDARHLGALLAKAGYGVLTGGGPGIMEAGNRGAFESGGISVGLNIELPMVYPGGFGTLDEFSETLTLVQTQKVRRVPIVLVGRKFWEPLLTWFRDGLFKSGMISREDLELFRVVDSADEAFAYIKECHSHGISTTVLED